MKKTLQALVLTLAATLFASPAAFAATFRWVGGQDPDHTDASQLNNWSESIWPPAYIAATTLPGNGDTVSFVNYDWDELDNPSPNPGLQTLNLTSDMWFNGLSFENAHYPVTIGSGTGKSLIIGAVGISFKQEPSGDSDVFNVDIKLAASQTWNISAFNGAANNYLFNNEVHTQGHTLTLKRSANGQGHQFDIDDPITGTGKVMVTNSATHAIDNEDELLTVVLEGDNTYSGGTEIEYGRVLLGGTLRGNIIIGGDPLGKAGTWVIATGSLAGISAANPGTLVFAANGGAYDQVIVYDEGTLDITNLQLDFAAFGAGFTEREYILIDLQGGSLIGTEFASVTGLPAGYWLEYDYSNGLQVALLIPEPTSLALLGLAGLGLLRRRRR